MKNDYYVYKHTAPNGKVYIGQTCQNSEARFGSGGYRYKGCTLFYNAIQKYGWDNFEHEILFQGLTQDEANKKEIELIEKCRSNEREFGYNLQAGGNNGSPSEETRIRISNSHIGKCLSEETKKKISLARTGQKDSDETRKKKSESHKGKHLSDETIKKLSEKGKQRTDVQERGRQCGYSNRGRKHTAEAKKHMSESSNPINHKRVLCVDTNVVYNSLSEAASDTGVWRQNIGKVCNNELQSAGGYKWMFV